MNNLTNDNLLTRGNRPEMDAFSLRYSSGKYLNDLGHWHESDSEWKAGEVYKILHQNGLTPQSVVDLGCGAGQVLVHLQRAMSDNVELAGYDISPQAIERARRYENTRLRFYATDFLKEETARCDVLTVLDVFEHVPDYLGFLRQLLNRAEWFVFHIPIDLALQSMNHQSAAILRKRHLYGHLHAFTREMALATLQDAGYEIVDDFYTNDHEIDNSQWSGGLRQRMVYLIRRGLYRIKPNLAVLLFRSFNVMVLARKSS